MGAVKYVPQVGGEGVCAVTQLSRRSFFAGLGALLAAPAVVKVVSLIPPLEAARVRSFNYLTANQITREAVKLFVNSNAFIVNIDCQYDDLFSRPNAKIGTTLRIRLPADFSITETRKLTA